MNLDHLRYFVALSQTENYTQTAKLLHITQPSLTKAIHHLEKEIHVSLFKKSGRNVVLTEAGRVFANGVTTSLNSLDDSISEIKTFNQKKTNLKLVSIRTLSIKWLPEITQRFLKLSHKYQIHFQFNTDSGFSPDILQAIRDKKYDVGFCSRLDGYDDLEFFPVAQQNLVCITPINHPLANRSSISLKETLSYRQVTFSKRSDLNPILHDLFEESGGQPISSYEVEEDQTVAGLVANDFGIAVVPNMSILESLPVKIIPLSFPNWRRILYMATLKSSLTDPAIKDFVQFVQKESKQLANNNI